VPSLLVTNDFPPKLGGIQSYLHELWRRLPPEETTVLTTPYAGDRPFDADQAFRIERTPEPVLLPTPSLARRIDALAREVGADVIFLDPALPLGLVTRKLTAAPKIIVLHGSEVTVPARLPGSRALLRGVLRQAAGVLAAGEYPSRVAASATTTTLRGLVLQPGVDVERFSPAGTDDERGVAREKLGLDRDAVTVVGVSRLVPRKGFDVLIDAVSLLEEHVQLVIAGDGRDRERLQERAQRLGLGDRARFLGRVAEEDLPTVYRAGDIFSMMCRDRWHGLEAEGFGIVFLEAAAAGLPAVAGRSGGAHEAVIDGTTGFVVDPDDVTELHHALERLVLDPDLRARLGAAARKRAVEECSYERRVEPLRRLAAGELAMLAPLPS
jgi:phosphatidylinositol alpha-1,6-mannosyltransferase